LKNQELLPVEWTNLGSFRILLLSAAARLQKKNRPSFSSLAHQAPVARLVAAIEALE
jgi:hypothetical protein